MEFISSKKGMKEFIPSKRDERIYSIKKERKNLFNRKNKGKYLNKKREERIYYIEKG